MHVHTGDGALSIVLLLTAAFYWSQRTVRAQQLSGENVCYNEETYTELEQVRTTHPVKIRSYNWCLSFPPRCSNYRTEMKEVLRLQNVTKTRRIEFCCDGYAEHNAEYNRTSADPATTTTDAAASLKMQMCVPKCRGGCMLGECTAPNQCTCSIGFEGKHCTQRCRFQKFGQNCLKQCRCRNGALCDHRTGYCRCTAGWVGEICERPCPTGTYGIMCKRMCDFCSSGRCEPQTGVCLAASSTAPHIIFSTPRNADVSESRAPVSTSGPTSPYIMRVGGFQPAGNVSDSMRIKAKHWIAVTGNGKMQLRNCTRNCRPVDMEKLSITATNVTKPVDGAQLASLIDQTHRHHVRIQQNHTAMMTALNSSIVNLTTDVGKLSQQIVGQQQQQQQPIDPKVTLILDSNTILTGNGVDGDTSDVDDQNSAANVLADPVIEQVHVDGADKTTIGEDTNEYLANDIVHVLTLHGLNQSADSQVAHMENPPMVPVVLVVLVALILLSLIAFGFTYIVRRANGAEPVGQRVTRRAQHVQEIKLAEHVVQKPLPDIPSFTQSFTRREAQQEFYDHPISNLSIASGPNTLGYSYTTRKAGDPTDGDGYPADFVVVELMKKAPQRAEAFARKPSCEHIYDEIKYVDRQVGTQPESQR